MSEMKRVLTAVVVWFGPLDITRHGDGFVRSGARIDDSTTRIDVKQQQRQVTALTTFIDHVLERTANLQMAGTS